MGKINRICVFAACLLIGMLFISESVISASSGKLKTKTIIECNGNYYGQHSDDNHWHKAVKHDSGWYPDGGNLGTSNPCGTTAPQVNDAKKDQEEAARIAIEEERLEKIRIEEEIRMNDTSVERIEISGIPWNEKDLLSLSVDSLNDITINLNNNNASYSQSLRNEALMFSDNYIEILVTSENKQKTENYSIPVFILGTNEELLSLDNVTIKIKEQEFSLRDGVIFVDNIVLEDITAENITGIFIDGQEQFATAVKQLETSNSEGVSHVLTITENGVLYYIPLFYKEASDGIEALDGIPILFTIGAAAIAGLGALSSIGKRNIQAIELAIKNIRMIDLRKCCKGNQ